MRESIETARELENRMNASFTPNTRHLDILSTDPDATIACRTFEVGSAGGVGALCFGASHSEVSRD